MARRLVANVDAALEKQIFDIPQRKRVADIRHDDEPDHLGRGIEPAKGVVELGHGGQLGQAGYHPANLR